MTRLAALIDSLERFYGPLAQPPTDPFALFVWEVLSVQSTPRKRDAAFSALKRQRALTPDAVWRAPEKQLQESVALAGPYLEPRLQALRAGVDQFRRQPRLSATICGPLREARRALAALPHMRGGGAVRMLLFAADRPVLPVDATIARVAGRLSLGEHRMPFARFVRTVRRDLSRELPRSADAFRRAHLYLAHHGAVTCTETRPHCRVCPVKHDCPSIQQDEN